MSNLKMCGLHVNRTPIASDMIAFVLVAGVLTIVAIFAVCQVYQQHVIHYRRIAITDTDTGYDLQRKSYTSIYPQEPLFPELGWG
jgi:hypothetical protein